jgi:cytidylate kinase
MHDVMNDKNAILIFMIKKQIITIAGKPGSGKSTAAKGVANTLNFDHFSSGGLFREISKEQGMDVLQANLNAENNKNIDYLVDEKLRELGEAKDALVIDSRMAWHWMPYSFRVFLDLDVSVAAGRIIHEKDTERTSGENIPNSQQEYANELEERLESETRRYKGIYNVNPYDKANYDLVVDTNINSIPEVIDIIVEEYKKWWNLNS